jgi:hypothetical protein
MLPVIHGLIARRVLLNFRAEPAAVQRLLPEPLKVQTQVNYAIIGVCLIRFEQLRPIGMPASFGISTENMAHRVAVLYPTATGMKPGVYIWRRETNSQLIACLGGTVFPGVHTRGQFDVSDSPDSLSMNVTSADGNADVVFHARPAEWTATPAFTALDGASDFFCHGSCGYSVTSDGRSFEGLELRTENWRVQPLHADVQRVSFFENMLPNGAFEFDCALIMRNVQHSWHQLPSLSRRVAHVG